MAWASSPAKVQRARDTAEFAASRLTGAQAPVLPDEETNFADILRRNGVAIGERDDLWPAE